jgi:DNA-binding MarR family transcriptional regulator
VVAFLTEIEYFDIRKDSPVSKSRQQLARELGEAMQRNQRSVQAFDDVVGRRLGLGPADLRCLDWLTGGPLTAGELSTAAGLKPAATTALVDRLARKGYVRRVLGDTDRRRVLVEMTEYGAERTRECYGPLVEEGQRLLAGFTRDELARMRALLDDIVEVTDRHRERMVAQG